MGLRYLGPSFDIHTGGIDNIFPHHEDEIAQSAALTGRPPARYWVHGEHLLAAGHKMAKSAGNFQRITELADDGADPLAFRYLTYTVHYSRKQNLSDASMAAARAGLASLQARLRALGPPPADGPWAAPPVLEAGSAGDRPVGIASGVSGHRSGGAPAGGSRPGYQVVDRAGAPGGDAPAPLSDAGRAFHSRFVASVDDDLDLPRALAVVREALKSSLPADERRWLALDADALLGLRLDRVWAAGAADHGTGAAGSTEPVPDKVQRLVDERAAARAGRDFARADALRTELLALGYELVDRPDGSTLRQIGG